VSRAGVPVIRRLSAGYSGGAFGALISSLALWAAGSAGLTASFGVAIQPALSFEWLGPRILWGGLFGLGFPWAARRISGTLRAGLVLSLLPSTVELFYSLPRGGHQMLGVDLGALTPVVVLLENAVWGAVLARAVKALGETSPPPE